MKLDEAMLLPNVHKEFQREVLANAGQFPWVKCITENELPNSRWLLSRLHVYFKDKLDVRCRHKIYGTLLYHNSCDMIQALSTALGKNQTHAENVVSSETCKIVLSLEKNRPRLLQWEAS